MKNKTHQELFELLKKDNQELEIRFINTQKSLKNIRQELELNFENGKIPRENLDLEIKLETKLEEIKNQIIKVRNYFNLVKQDYKMKVEKHQKQLQEQKNKKDNTLPF